MKSKKAYHAVRLPPYCKHLMFVMTWESRKSCFIYLIFCFGRLLYTASLVVAVSSFLRFSNRLSSGVINAPSLKWNIRTMKDRCPAMGIKD